MSYKQQFYTQEMKWGKSRWLVGFCCRIDWLRLSDWLASVVGLIGFGYRIDWLRLSDWLALLSNLVSITMEMRQQSCKYRRMNTKIYLHFMIWIIHMQDLGRSYNLFGLYNTYRNTLLYAIQSSIKYLPIYRNTLYAILNTSMSWCFWITLVA